VCDDVVGAHDEEHHTKPSEHGIRDDPIQQQHGDDNLQTGARIREHEGGGGGGVGGGVMEGKNGRKPEEEVTKSCEHL
jgi:hypothetical protein